MSSSTRSTKRRGVRSACSAAWSSGPPAVADARGAFRDVRRAAEAACRSPAARPRDANEISRDAFRRRLPTAVAASRPALGEPKARRRAVAGALRPGHGHPARRVRVRGVRLPGGHARRGRGATASSATSRATSSPAFWKCAAIRATTAADALGATAARRGERRRGDDGGYGRPKSSARRPRRKHAEPEAGDDDDGRCVMARAATASADAHPGRHDEDRLPGKKDFWAPRPCFADRRRRTASRCSTAAASVWAPRFRAERRRRRATSPDVHAPASAGARGCQRGPERTAALLREAEGRRRDVDGRTKTSESG